MADEIVVNTTGRLTIVIDERALKNAVSFAEGVQGVLQDKTNEIVDRANSMSSGFRTKRTFNYAENKPVGGTQPQYGGDVQLHSNGYVGLVHPLNYAALKDSYENNTILKAGGY